MLKLLIEFMWKIKLFKRYKSFIQPIPDEGYSCLNNKCFADTHRPLACRELVELFGFLCTSFDVGYTKIIYRIYLNEDV